MGCTGGEDGRGGGRSDRPPDRRQTCRCPHVLTGTRKAGSREASHAKRRVGFGRSPHRVLRGRERRSDASWVGAATFGTGDSGGAGDGAGTRRIRSKP